MAGIARGSTRRIGGASVAALLALAASPVMAAIPAPLYQDAGTTSVYSGHTLFIATPGELNSGFTLIFTLTPLAAAGGSFESIVAFGDPATTGWGLFFVPNTTQLHFSYRGQTGDFAAFTLTSTLTLNTPVTVALVSDPATGQRVLLNDALAAILPSVPPLPGIAPGTLSAAAAGYVSAHVTLQKLGLYNAPLSAAEIYSVEHPAVQSVPEPASWAMLIVGFGLSGALLRRRVAQATC